MIHPASTRSLCPLRAVAPDEGSWPLDPEPNLNVCILRFSMMMMLSIGSKVGAFPRGEGPFGGIC